MAECVHPSRWHGICTVCGHIEGDDPLKKQVVTPMPEAYTQFRSHTAGRAAQEKCVQFSPFALISCFARSNSYCIPSAQMRMLYHV